MSMSGSSKHARESREILTKIWDQAFQAKSEVAVARKASDRTIAHSRELMKEVDRIFAKK